jgi:hypothetical protein
VRAIHRECSVSLNASNHPSIGPAGLELVAGVPTHVTPEQGEYLRSLGVEVVEDPPNPKTPKKGQ